MILWWECIHNFVKNCISVSENDIKTDFFENINFINILQAEYANQLIYSSNTESNLINNLIDICTMIIFSNIQHVIMLNPTVLKILSNPFILSSTWNISDHINNLSEQIVSNYISFNTHFRGEALNQDWSKSDIGRHMNELSKSIFKQFQTNIQNLPINKNSILYIDNVGSSITY